MEATTTEAKPIQPTFRWDRKTLEFDLVVKGASFFAVADLFEKCLQKEVREICMRGLAKHNISEGRQADWYEKAIRDLMGAGDLETAGALLRQYRGLYLHDDPAIFRRSLAFACSPEARTLPPRVIARAIRDHLDGCHGDFGPIRAIYRDLFVRHALEYVLVECTRRPYMREDWETMEIVFWCAVHMKDGDCIPILQGIRDGMSSRRGPGKIYPAGGDIFTAERDRAVIERTAALIRAGVPARAHDLPPGKFKKWHS